jgi:TonB-linked SusC/RagA family outer membrane protein
MMILFYCIFKHPAALLSLIGGLLLVTPGFAQLLATTDGVSVNHSSEVRQEKQRTLSELLQTLQKQYHTTFLYEKRLLKDKRTSVVVDLKQDVETNLERMLEELPLTFDKIDDQTYVIVRSSRNGQVQKIHSRPLSNPDWSTAQRNQSLSHQSRWLASRSVRQNNRRANVLDKTISGTVTDAEDGQPLPGVNVLAKNTTIGTITDIDGKYTLSVPDETETLVFSSVGYAVQEVAVEGRSTINVDMAVSTQELGEVVVTALGIKKETKKLGYATAKVESEEITVNRTPNFMNTLQGKIAGVNISSSATGPGSTSKIRIRGQSSFQGQNSPLFVVNGVPINNSNFGVTAGTRDGGENDSRIGNNSDGGDGLTSINPDDIESMTVLKGAAAAALYGSRASNGVIMITTKNRAEGKGLGVEWNTNFTVDTPLDYTDYQYEYGQGENGERPTTPNPTSGVWSFGERFEPGMTQVLFEGVEVPYAPVRDRIRKFYRNGTNLTNTLTLSAGGENGGFNLSIANLGSRGIVPNSQYDRQTFNLGFTQNITPRFTISGNANYSIEDNKNPPIVVQQNISTPVVVYTLANSMPLDVLEANRLNANGDEFIWSRFRNRTNPYFSINERFENIKRDRLFGNLTARYSFTDWLYAQLRVGQDYYSRDQEFNFPTGQASIPAAPSGFVNGSYVQEARRFREVNSDFLIGVTQQFGDIGMDLTLGGNQRYERTDRNSVFVRDFVIRDLYTVMNGREKDPLYTLDERQINSLYGALELSYREYLYLTATARNDWFSTLSPANRSILYPSVTGSFVFSQAFTNFPNWISFGKIRAGYAEVGSDSDIAAYSGSLFYTVNNNLFPNPDGQQLPVASISSNTIPNADLRPMRVSEAEAGFELRLFDSRVGIDFTYYNKITRDQILAAQTSDASGYTQQLINVGESRNTGVELLLNVVPVQTQNLRWDVTFNGSYNTSEVLKLGLDTADQVITVGQGIRGETLRQVVGEPIGQLYGFSYLRDSQGRIVHSNTSGRPLRTANQGAFGTAIPLFIGGITNAISWKDLQFSFLIDFKLGHKMASGTNFNATRHGLHKATLLGREDGFVVGEGVNEDGEINTVQTPIQSYYETVGAVNIHEAYIYNAGFWQLRQMTLGYNFTRLLPTNSFVKGLRLSAVANNVLLLKKWVPNIHPEQMPSASDNLVGLEQTSLPLTRSIGFNLNIKF